MKAADVSVVFRGALAFGVAAPSVVSAGHAAAWKRDPRSLGWIAAAGVALPAGSGTEPLAPLRRLVDRVSHRSLMGGNRIVMFILDGDETGFRFAEALSAEAARATSRSSRSGAPALRWSPARRRGQVAVALSLR